jgi:hypothetical protein
MKTAPQWRTLIFSARDGHPEFGTTALVKVCFHLCASEQSCVKNAMTTTLPMGMAATRTVASRFAATGWYRLERSAMMGTLSLETAVMLVVSWSFAVTTLPRARNSVMMGPLSMGTDVILGAGKRFAVTEFCKLVRSAMIQIVSMGMGAVLAVLLSSAAMGA